MGPSNRRSLVLASTLNGIDFVEVADDAQTALRVHFLNAVPLRGTLVGPRPVSISGGEAVPTVAVGPINDAADWSIDDTHLVLTLRAAAPGDFSDYTLTIASPRLDPFFSSSAFSFKARCPSDLDCQPAPVACPTPEADAPTIDYLAKDFLSFRQALLDFSATRYPEWQERSEADFGVMFLEALCSLADDLSYTQDRIAAESSLATATQRRSVARLARLVDYEPRPAASAAVLLQFDVAAGVTALPDGTAVTATGPDGTPVPFETGPALVARLVDPVTGQARPQATSTAVSPAWNRGVIRPYWFDDSQRCLPIGATSMTVLGRGFNFQPGQALLIETAGDPADPPIRQVVRLLDTPGDQAAESCDPLYPTPTGLVNPPPILACAGTPTPAGTGVTLITWGAADALTARRDLTVTTLAGNLVPATQGITQPAEPFAIPPGVGPTAIVRTGPDDSPGSPSLQYLHTLRGSPLAWLTQADPASPSTPELILTGPDDLGGREVWTYRRWLLDAGPLDPAYTVDPASYAPLAAGPPRDTPYYDYDGDDGATLRFGDGAFGATPVPGSAFAATYRVGGGTAGNVAADSITSFDPASGRIVRVSNPLPASGGADAEPLETTRRLAPQAFRAVSYRAVLPGDYQATAETLPWVQRAGASFRWTGSWATIFTTPDPLHSEQITIGQRQQLIDLLNRRRMAGYESYVSDPRYVALDLLIEVCARADAFRGDVEAAITSALGSAPGGFFDPDRFTFGGPLRLGDLEAAVQRANGVAGVTCVRYRVRGRTSGYTPLVGAVTVGTDEIIRCDNDPSRPAQGSIGLTIRGGK